MLSPKKPLLSHITRSDNNLDQNSASESQPNFSLKILNKIQVKISTKFQPQKSRQKFSLKISTKIQHKNLQKTSLEHINIALVSRVKKICRPYRCQTASLLVFKMAVLIFASVRPKTCSFHCAVKKWQILWKNKHLAN